MKTSINCTSSRETNPVMPTARDSFPAPREAARLNQTSPRYHLGAQHHEGVHRYPRHHHQPVSERKKLENWAYQLDGNVSHLLDLPPLAGSQVCRQLPKRDVGHQKMACAKDYACSHWHHKYTRRS